MLNCEQATRLLSERMDRELARHERLALRLHLLICTGCRHCGRQFTNLRLTARAFTKGLNEKGD
ncbi:MAG: zf-HC2 domain-containing protein [Alphaproteobacteria bacterium]|nr:MAG: zf-HC2 domain-containing protein [Alphaproteobacteria bacterium]